MTHPALILVGCSLKMTSFGGFQWPRSGPVKSDAWDPEDYWAGLHGFLWGEGDSALAMFPRKNWLVVRAPQDTIVPLKGWVKFPEGEVVFCGALRGALRYLQEHDPDFDDRVVMGHTKLGCGGGTVTVGEHGTATIGDHGVAIAQRFGRATAGVSGIARTGDGGHSVVGNHGTAISGTHGVSLAGNYGLACSGFNGESFAGIQGKASTKGGGVATVYDGGEARAGEGGQIRFCYTASNKRGLVIVGHVGKDGILPNIFYKVVNGAIVPA